MILVQEKLSTAMRNGSRLEAAGIGAHKRLSEYASPEFKERLHSALLDEERHVVMQRELADRLWTGLTPASTGVRLLAHKVLHESSPEWAMVALNLTERAFEFRLRAIARLSRQMGYRFMYDPLMEISADEGRHVLLVRDMLRSTSGFSTSLIANVTRWVVENEESDTSGLFPGDRLIPRMAERLLEEMS